MVVTLKEAKLDAARLERVLLRMIVVNLMKKHKTPAGRAALGDVIESINGLVPKDTNQEGNSWK